MPIAAAASSSSRMAIQARPRRESRSSSDVAIAMPSSASARPVVPGRVDLLDEVARQERQRAVDAVAEAEAVDAGQPERAVRQVEAADVVAVAHELRDDLAEAERHDREVVAAQAQRRNADQHAEQRGEDRSDQDHEPGREVDAERAVRHGAAEDPAARAVQAAAELLRGQPAGHVGAAGEERHVAEVEQAGVADDDVQADAHDRERDDHEGRRGVGDPLRRLRQDVVVEPRVEHEQGEQRRRAPAAIGMRAESCSLMRASRAPRRAGPGAGRRGSG